MSFKHFDTQNPNYIRAVSALCARQRELGLDLQFQEDEPGDDQAIRVLLALTTGIDNDFVMEYHFRLLADQILAAAPSEKRAQLSQIPIGILPRSKINAYSHKNGYIAVEIGIASAIWAVAKIMGLILYPKQDVDRGILSELFVRSIQGLLGNNSIFLPKIGVSYLSDQGRDFATKITRYQEVFLLCHEYGHFILNHLTESSTPKLYVKFDEVDADYQGFLIFERYVNYHGIDERLAYTAVDMFFTQIWLAQYLIWPRRIEEPSKWSLEEHKFEETGKRMLMDSFSNDEFYINIIGRKSEFHHWLGKIGMLPGFYMAEHIDRVMRETVEYNLSLDIDRSVLSRTASEFEGRHSPGL